MPNFDGGHYFLTTLAPIRVGSPAALPKEQRRHFDDPEDGASFVQRIQQVLGDMPTALQSPATEEIGIAAPFTKSLRTHLCRFVVIEDVIYNGRPGDDALLTALGVRDGPLEPKPVDQLPCAYLMFVVDFDAVMEPGQPLPNKLSQKEQDAIRDHYLKSMWVQGSAELMKIYKNCQAFDPDTIQTPDQFAAYMARCQQETWMSFNDYYVDPPELPALPLKGFLVSIGAPALAFLIGLLSWLFGISDLMGMPSLAVALAGGVATVASFYLVYRYIIWQGQKPWPAAPDGDLPSVLKGLYLQQRFSDFVVEAQGRSAEDLHRAFGQFLTDHRPRDVLDPETTQAPGIIRS